MASRTVAEPKLVLVKPRVSPSLTIGFAVAAVALELIAVSLYWAAADFSIGLSVEPTRLLRSGPIGASLIRWGSLVDLLGYLCIAPVVLHLRERYSASRFADLLAAAGLALVVVGSIGAAAMAAAAPPLINDYAGATSSQKQALVPAFETLYRLVVLGLWQTLETIPATVWLLGNAAAARANGPRPLSAVLLTLGVITGAIALYRIAAS